MTELTLIAVLFVTVLFMVMVFVGFVLWMVMGGVSPKKEEEIIPFDNATPEMIGNVLRYKNGTNRFLETTDFDLPKRNVEHIEQVNPVDLNESVETGEVEEWQ